MHFDVATFEVQHCDSVISDAFDGLPSAAVIEVTNRDCPLAAGYNWANQEPSGNFVFDDHELAQERLEDGRPIIER